MVDPRERTPNTRRRVSDTNIHRTGAAWALLVIPVVLAGAAYARFFGGFWLGDDFANVHRVWIAAQRGELLAQAWSQFTSAVPSQGAFYRPLMMGSLALNQWLAGTHYAGWFAVNLAVHLANVALTAVLVARLAAVCGRDGRAAGALAGAFLALCPLCAEGVFWISARADAWVTLLTLAAFWFWARPATSAVAWAGLPLLLLPALGFKESAAVLPLQMLLVALAWPRRPAPGQRIALVVSFVVVALFLGMRALLFDSVWHVYPAGDAPGPAARLWQGLSSLPAWWSGLARATPATALVYPLFCIGALCAALASTDGAPRRLAVALAAASAGLAVATLSNLGGLDPSGEGGRLAYGPVAWLALALGVGLSRPIPTLAVADDHPRARRAGLLLLAAAVLAGGWAQENVLRTAYAAQRDVRALAIALRGWADAHPGLTLLVVPESLGPVVALRNGQGGLVLPPVQAEPLLHRVLPTLPRDLASRHAQLAAGLATRLDEVRPASLEPEDLRRVLVPAAVRWPEHYACWDGGADSGIVALAPPASGEGERWVTAMREAISRCRL